MLRRLDGKYKRFSAWGLSMNSMGDVLAKILTDDQW